LIIIELVYNLSLLVALSVVSVFIEGHWSHNSTIGKVLQGVLFGLITVVGMMYPFVLSEGIIFDGRSIVISIASLFFGPLAGLITSAMAAFYRLYIGGGGALTGVLVVLSSYVIGIAFHFYRVRSKSHQVSIVTLLNTGIAVHVSMFALMTTLPAAEVAETLKSIGITVLFIFPLITVVIGAIVRNQLAIRKYLGDIEESEEKIRLLIDSTDDIIFTVDADKIITGVYGSYSKIRGRTADEYNGKTVDMILPKENAKLHDEMLNQVLAGDITTYEWFYDTASGKQYIQTKLTPIRNSQKKIVGAVGVGRNITERKLAELEIRSQLDKLTQISWIQSHIVRAPVARIMSLVELLADEQGTIEAEDSREILQYVMNSAKELDGIIQDISDKSESTSRNKKQEQDRE
jgi:PAS domain S-box-containing protein